MMEAGEGTTPGEGGTGFTGGVEVAAEGAELVPAGIAAAEFPPEIVVGGATVTAPREKPASLMASIADPNGLPTKPGMA